MQLGIRLHDGEKLPVEELLPIIKSRGFKCAHIALSKSCKDIPGDPAALTPGLAMYLRKQFAENDIDIAVLGCYLNLADPDKERLAENTRKYLAHIRFASLMGCGVVGTETGAPNSEYRFVPECRSEEALATFIKNLRPVVGYAEKMGVILAIEPVYKHIVYSPERARIVLDTINSPNLQIIFDPVNLLAVDNLSERDRLLARTMDILGDDIAVVHIKDYKVQGDELVSIAAGTGEMDYTEIMRFIKKRKPYIHVTLENTTPENAEAARKYIQGIYDSI
ncbi:MAG: sugar phosphate isomerase/epimerase [Oscillospiraceae bacterium]|nr:sugar phosphate isomerase/epimerase [Oscillospiraceae bacterium]